MSSMPRVPRAFAIRLAAIAGLALAVRLVWALVVMRHAPVTGDGREFHGLAHLLATKHRYIEPGVPGSIETAEKPPLYPLVLALPDWLGIGTVRADRIVSCLLGTGTVAVVGLVGRRVAGERVVLVAAAIAAVYPALFALDSTVRSESLYALLIALALLGAYRLGGGRRPRSASRSASRRSPVARGCFCWCCSSFRR